MKPDSVANALIWIFFASDFLLRKGKASASLKNSSADKNSTIAIIASYLAVLGSEQILKYFNFGWFNNSFISWMAAAVMVFGIFIRAFSMLKLKSGYTRILKVGMPQTLYTDSIYKNIRHPGYLGSLMVWSFYGLGIGNYMVSAVGFLFVTSVYFYRIKNEEQMLRGEFGAQYEDYCKRSWRLLPFVW